MVIASNDMPQNNSSSLLKKRLELLFFYVEKDYINPNLEVLVGLTVPELF